MNHPATIRNAISFIHESNSVKDSFKISVSLPRGYDNQSKSYSVLYVMDGNIFFGLVNDTVRLLEFGKEIEDLIVVGVGYELEENHMTLRNRDYLPTAHESSIGSGGADKFLGYIATELKPYIESHYRTKENDATLFGDSYSGLFAVYTYFNSNNLFQRFIIGSPSLYWDDKIIFEYEKKSLQLAANFETKMFLSVGALEAVLEPKFANMVGNVEELSHLLKGENHRHLDLTTHIFENETHLSVIPATISRGLREVFK